MKKKFRIIWVFEPEFFLKKQKTTVDILYVMKTWWLFL